MKASVRKNLLGHTFRCNGTVAGGHQTKKLHARSGLAHTHSIEMIAAPIGQLLARNC